MACAEVVVENGRAAIEGVMFVFDVVGGAVVFHAPR